MGLILLCVWSGQPWGRRDKGCWLIATRPIGPAELPPEGHVLSGPCPLHTSTTYPGSRPSELDEAHTTYTHTQTLYPLGAMLRRWSGPCVPSRLWCEGEGRRERDGKIVLNQSQPSILLMEKVTALLLPFSSHSNCNFGSFCLSHLYYSTHQM